MSQPTPHHASTNPCNQSQGQYSPHHHHHRKTVIHTTYSSSPTQNNQQTTLDISTAATATNNLHSANQVSQPNSHHHQNHSIAPHVMMSNHHHQYYQTNSPIQYQANSSPIQNNGNLSQFNNTNGAHMLSGESGVIPNESEPVYSNSNSPYDHNYQPPTPNAYYPPIKQEADNSNVNSQPQLMKNEHSTIPIITSTLPLEGLKTEDTSSQADSVSTEVPDYNIQLKISNVVCKYRVKCHINLKKVALEGFNTEYDRARGRVMMRLRKPACYANIWSSGKISIYGAKSEPFCEQGARRIARYLQKRLGFKVRMCAFEIVNCLGSTRLPFGVKLDEFSRANRGPHMQYEPELHAAANYKFKETGANIKIYQNGAIAGTARNVDTLRKGIADIFPLLEVHRKAKLEADPVGSTEDSNSEFEGGSDQEFMGGDAGATKGSQKRKKRGAGAGKPKAKRAKKSGGAGRGRKAKKEIDSDDEDDYGYQVQAQRLQISGLENMKREQF